MPSSIDESEFLGSLNDWSRFWGLWERDIEEIQKGDVCLNSKYLHNSSEEEFLRDVKYELERKGFEVKEPTSLSFDSIGTLRMITFEFEAIFVFRELLLPVLAGLLAGLILKWVDKQRKRDTNRGFRNISLKLIVAEECKVKIISIRGDPISVAQTLDKIAENVKKKK